MQREQLVSSSGAEKQHIRKQVEEEKARHKRHLRSLNERLQLVEDDLTGYVRAGSKSNDQNILAKLDDALKQMDEDQ